MQASEQGKRSTDRVITFVKDEMMAGRLRVGDKLPPERELSSALGVGRPLLREAIRSLHMLGILESRQGSGTYVTRADVSVIAGFFTFCLAQERDTLEDVMQARIAIECQAIRLACDRATEADLARMAGWLQKLMDTLDDPEAGGEADFMFHRSMVAASHSLSLVALYTSLSDLLKNLHVERRQSVYTDRSVMKDLVKAHREVFLPIAARDPEAADKGLRAHFAIGDDLRRRSLIATYRQDVAEA